MAPADPLQIVIMGVCGSGKTLLASLLEERLDCACGEGDLFHSETSIAKMTQGQPLDDADRWPWLGLLGTWIAERAHEGRGAVMTCSALKRSYRDVLRASAPNLIFIHLDGSRDLLLRRLSERQRHFMPACLLDSQLEILEPLAEDERGAVFDIASTPEALADAVMAYLEQVPCLKR